MATSDDHGMGLGLQILCAACANILTSSLMAVFNAWIFRQGYHFQFSLIVVQQAVCSLFAFLQVTHLPGEKEKVRISASNYFRMLLPFSVCVAAKLYIQNKAFEYVSPAFYAMIASTLPVGVTLLSIVRGIEPFRKSTVGAAVLVSVGGVMIKFGEVALSPLGLALTCTALVLDVVRLVLMQYLVQPLRLSGPGLMMLSSPLQCALCALGAVFFESAAVASSVEAGNFPPLVWFVLLCNGALAMLVNLVIFVFVKVANAIVVAITTPFKDLSTIVMSDSFVVRREETPLSIAGFALACSTSLVYNIHNIYRKEREKAERLEKEPLIPESRETEKKEDADEDATDWRFDDAATALAACCAVGILLVSTAVLAQVDLVRVADAYSLR